MNTSSKKIFDAYEALYAVPTVLVTCIDKDNKPNIITIAWTGVVSSGPPSVSISIRPGRYSFDLIKNQKEFAVNIPNEQLLRQTDYCGVVSGRKVDKFKETGLTAIPASKIKSPLIKECPVNIECKLANAIDLGCHYMFVGEVLCVHADKSVLDTQGEIDYSKTKPITYNQGEYWSLGQKLGFYGISKGKL